MSRTVLRTVIAEQTRTRPYLTFQLSKNIHQVARLSNTSLNNEQVDLRKVAVILCNYNYTDNCYCRYGRDEVVYLRGRERDK